MRELPSNKEILKSTLPNLGLLAFIIALRLLFNTSYAVLIAVLLSWSLANNLFKVYEKNFIVEKGWGWRLIKNQMLMIMILGVFYVVAKYTGEYGLLGLLILIFFFALYILWRKKKIYMMAVRDVERQIWGMTAEERRDKRREYENKN